MPIPASRPPAITTRRGPILSCNLPPKSMAVAKTMIATVYGSPAWLLLHSQPPAAMGAVIFDFSTLQA
jgi:hypothetical protein